MVAKAETLVQHAVSQHSPLSPRGIMERSFAVWFDSFVYNQIWEDPRVDMEALQLDGDSRILTIASGGCNVLSYLSKSPASVTALDINQYHIYLTRLKLAAFKRLPAYNDFFRFFGCADHTDNVDSYYKYVCQHLDAATRTFWEGGSWMRRKILKPRINYFAVNLYNHAKLGYLLRFIHGLCRLTRRDPSRLLSATTKAEQVRVFDETVAPFFDSKLIRLIGKQPLILFSLGIPPSQVDAMREDMHGDIVGLYRERVRRLICDFPVDENYFVWQAVGRKYDRDKRYAVPDYLKEDNYESIKRNIDRVTTGIAHLTEHLKQQPASTFNRFVLLDSQDWMKPAQIEELWTEIARVGGPGTRIVFRTGSVVSPIESVLSPALRARFVYEHERSLSLFKQDRSAIYGGFHIYSKRD